MRIARKHLGWYTRGARRAARRSAREINAADTTAAQLAAVDRFFDRLAASGERLVYRGGCAAEASSTPAAASRPRHDSATWAGEALAA